jgi:cytochrome c
MIMHKFAFTIPGLATVAMVFVAMSAQCANAQSATENVAAGQALAQQYCAECHIVVPSGNRGWTDAPAFVEIANRQGTTQAKLSAFIQTPHMHMLNTDRPPHEADAISAYIMSLRKN